MRRTLYIHPTYPGGMVGGTNPAPLSPLPVSLLYHRSYVLNSSLSAHYERMLINRRLCSHPVSNSETGVGRDIRVPEAGMWMRESLSGREASLLGFKPLLVKTGEKRS